MILKGSQRSGGQDLAVHLMRTDDNEHVRLHELRGFASDNLKGAFKEAQAISRGTRCRQYLFSLSLSPPEQEKVSVESFELAVARVERRLGLEGQPRAIVFHEKEGRRHAHCVWSRIDAQTMTARPMSFYKKKLMGISRDLYLEHGWTMPRGLENAAERNPTNFSLAEWQQARRQGIDPRWLKATLQDCWKRSDNRQAFIRSLEERGFLLAKGDKRGLVVLDHGGEVHALPRLLDLKTKEVRDRLGDGADLASVEASRKIIGQRMTPALRRHVAESKEQFQDRAARLGEAKQAMTDQHRAARERLEERQQAAQRLEARDRQARLPKGLRGLWFRVTGQYQEMRAGLEAEARESAKRHEAERESLIEAQLTERQALQAGLKELRQDQAKQLLELREDIGRFWRFSRGQEAAPSRRLDASERGAGRGLGLGLHLNR
ncbi:relaxase/mobilization nuclease domain-containing protein [Roseomonas sp. E05]|uniref:relaxase/mobilization nuclease domain-containing protein n=1 Tax=Roseomonas sp. E05 TaxID=3046310 RepID=UPI0024BAC251|nr:relaxase/mobilization nuclease domain-containing protein [Roseomonas sp. E05]MDJ0387329.1 relaxase/mobilization nuclease domain-containing protein [Roseomonas sp. E05]